MTTFLSLEKMQSMVPGSYIVNASLEQTKKPIYRFSTDSRKIEQDDFFIALVGEQFDGNTFISNVMSKGAIGAIASKPEFIPQDFPALLVPDTLRALQKIASAWRHELDTTIIVVTGSNGKTTVKEMIASILREAFGSENVLATLGNLNNEIGLPLTLLRLQEHHQMAVIELGMNHPGETSLLAKIAQPNIVLINNAQREHQEFMHTVEAVAREHADAIKELLNNGVAIFPADSEFTSIWKQVAKDINYLDFSLSPIQKEGVGNTYGVWAADGTLDIYFKISELNIENIKVKLNTLGDHNAKNAIAATSVALAAQIGIASIQKGLEKFIPVEGRMRTYQLPRLDNRSCLVDDTYNANPDSVIAAIDVLAKLSGTKWLVLGDMGEVGDQGKEFHQEIGEYAQRKGIDYLYATGELSTYAVEGFNTSSQDQVIDQGVHFAEQKSLLKQLKSNLQDLEKNMNASIAVLVKGSRFTKMERIVQALLKEESLCF